MTMQPPTLNDIAVRVRNIEAFLRTNYLYEYGAETGGTPSPCVWCGGSQVSATKEGASDWRVACLQCEAATQPYLTASGAWSAWNAGQTVQEA